MCRAAPCLCTLLTSGPFLFVCFVGLYAGHPYIHLISFEIFLLAFLIASNKEQTKHVYLNQLRALVVLFLDTSLHEFSSMDNVYNYIV